MAKEKKKKEKSVSVNLPKARQSMKRQKEVGQMKANHNDMWSAIGIILLILLILFVIMGGVNQWGVIKWFASWAKGIGESISNWLSGGEVITNNNGIYWIP